MSQQPKITLDQWSALAAVVDTGSYANAAESLHKSQSTLTYAIQKIEELLGVEIFKIEGRKAVLTPNGELLYRRGRTLLDEATQLETVAGQLAKGWEAEITIVAEILFPTWLLMECMAEFGNAHPAIRIELIESVMGGTEEALVGRRADIAITPVIPPGFVGEALAQVRFVCMAAPSHPLHRLGRPITLNDMRRHRHLVIRDSGARRDKTSALLNEQRWTVSNKATSIRAAVMGLGFAWYPEDSVREEVQNGALKALPLKEGSERFATLYLVLTNGDAAGPGARELASIIQNRVRNTCTAHLPGTPQVVVDNPQAVATAAEPASAKGSNGGNKVVPPKPRKAGAARGRAHARA